MPDSRNNGIRKSRLLFEHFLHSAYLLFDSMMRLSPGLALSHQCHYCKAGPDSKVVNVFHLDDQCLSGRTGILCGACNSQDIDEDFST